jgi:hypothetical protein
MSEPGLDDDENMPEAPVPVAAQSMNRRQSTTSKSDDDYVGSPFFMSCCMKRGDPVRDDKGVRVAGMVRIEGGAL